MSDILDLKEKVFTFSWKIKNFSYCMESIRSPEFITRNNRKWCLRVHKHKTNQIRCYLVRIESSECITLDYEISFLTCDSSPEAKLTKKAAKFRKSKLNKNSKHRNARGMPLCVANDIIYKSRQNSFLPKDTLTIKCQMWNSEDDFEAKQAFASSQLFLNATSRKHFPWPVDNLKKPFKSDKRNIPLFNSKTIKKSDKFFLNFTMDDESNETKAFQIKVRRPGGKRRCAILKLFIFDINGKALDLVTEEFVFGKMKTQQIWQLQSVNWKNKITEIENYFQCSNLLFLMCEFVTYIGIVTKETSGLNPIDSISSHSLESCGRLLVSDIDENRSQCSEYLKNDLKQMLDDGIFCDLKLRVGTETIPVHRSILSARSSVFRTMLENRKSSDIVDVEDVEAYTMRQLLLYVYTGNIGDLQWENIAKLYSVGDKFKILCLKEKFEGNRDEFYLRKRIGRDLSSYASSLQYIIASSV
ncbi:TD and POZ domain-containing protein 1-like [Caerostris darwini]|uniref:TD and POZ domain-containing protein 1-like n=1 Tax=Caerostris darwini TaxID=1538125 RepID=A0AAV4MHE4_9ARAC|nr:TD and POZ domain-containing protein 1-like [Caerostris darwini]